MKRASLLLLVLAGLLLLGGFSQADSAPPERIVSLTPSITEIIYALEVDHLLVGVTSWCTYPPEAQEKQIVGDAFAVNLEVLVDLEPDLIVGDAALVASHIEKLEELDLPVFTIAPATLAELKAGIAALGSALGKEAEGAALAEAMADDMAALAATAPEKGPRVFVETWDSPLSTAGPGSFIHELLILAGAENIAGDAAEPWVQFSEEQVIARDPEVIILTNYNRDDVLKRPAWAELSAVQQKRVYEIDPDLLVRAAPRLVDGLAALLDLLYE